MQDEEKRIDLGTDQIKQAADLRIKFFYHWSILSGATTTLVVPLITEIKSSNGVINAASYAKTSIILLLAVILLSSITNFLSANSIAATGRQNIGAGGKSDSDYILRNKMFSRLQKTIQYTAIVGYIFALIILYLFISKNLF